MEVNRPGQPSYAGTATFMKVPLVLDEEELREADVVVLGAPVDDLVTYRPGARFGPRAIREAADDSGPSAWHVDLGIDPFATLKVVDHGDVAIVPMDAVGNLQRIRDAVAAVCAAGAVPLVLGGDHSISYPTIAATAGHHGDLAVVHLDTHADTASENFGNAYAHGTPFRRLVDEGCIRGDRLVQIGLRGYWPGPEEFAWMEAAGITWFRMEQVIEEGIDQVVEDALARIPQDTPVFVSVDIDVLDPAFAPGTGTPEPGGMSTRELLRALRLVAASRAVVGCDVVEVCPPYDHASITAMAAHRCVLEILSGIAARRRRVPGPETP